MPQCSRRCDISGLSRSIWSPTPALAWMWFASFVVFLGASIADGAGYGARSAIAVFLGWAIVREIMPRGALVSFMVPIITALLVLNTGETDLAACFGVLLAARIVSGTVGRMPTLLDCGLLVIFCGWIAQRGIGLPVAVIVGAALVSVRTTRTRVAGAACILVALWIANDAGTLGVATRDAWTRGSTGEQFVASLLVVSALILVWPLPAKLRIHTDKKWARLRGGRITAARIVVLAALLAAVVWEGLAPGLFGLSAACGAVIATAASGGRLRAAKIDWTI